MSGLNKNYTLGKGKCYFEPFVNGVSANAGELYFSQTTDVGISVKADKLDHYDSDEGLNVLDEQVTVKVDVTGKFTTENITADVVSQFFLNGTVNKSVVTAATAITETFVAKPGRFYQLGRSATMPSGVRGVTVTSVKKGTTALTMAVLPAVQGTADVLVDPELGRIYLNPAITAVVDGDAIDVLYNVAAGNREVVISSSNQIRGALRFISANPVGGQRDFYFPLVNMTPQGDYALKGADWQKVGFEFSALKSGNLERIYIDGRYPV